MSLFEELIEYTQEDEKIVKSFKSKESLSPQIFEKTGDGYVLKSEIKKKLLDISDNFIEFLGVEFFIHDIILTGSLANYNWSNYSDVDLHILVDMDEFDNDKKSDSVLMHQIIKEYFDAKKALWNEKHEIKIKGYDLEIYVQDVNEPHVSSGVYSILNNKWVVEPEESNPKIDDRKILEKGEEYAKKIDILIKNHADKDTLKKIDDLRKKIKEFRQSGLEDGGEYSYENLTFKLLRRNGYIEKLMNLKNKLTDKSLSIS